MDRHGIADAGNAPGREAEHVIPARMQNSSSARRYGASGSSSSRVASPNTIETGRTGATRAGWRGAASRRPSERRRPRPPTRSRSGAGSPRALAGPERLLHGALDRPQRQGRLDGGISPLTLVRNQSRRRANWRPQPGLPAPSETADEIDRPSCSASRSAAISPCVNRRCLPGQRWGLGNPNLRSHARNVLGLTFSNVAASLVFR